MAIRTGKQLKNQECKLNYHNLLHSRTAIKHYNVTVCVWMCGSSVHPAVEVNGTCQRRLIFFELIKHMFSIEQFVGLGYCSNMAVQHGIPEGTRSPCRYKGLILREKKTHRFKFSWDNSLIKKSI